MLVNSRFVISPRLFLHCCPCSRSTPSPAHASIRHRQHHFSKCKTELLQLIGIPHDTYGNYAALAVVLEMYENRRNRLSIVR